MQLWNSSKLATGKLATGIAILLIVGVLRALPTAAQDAAPADQPEEPAATKAEEPAPQSQSAAAKQEEKSAVPATAKQEEKKPAAPAAVKQEEKKPAAPAAARPAQPPSDAPATYTVKAGLIKVELALKGWFEPVTTSEVAFALKRWSTLKVRRVVEHGAEVRRGDVLIEFETDKIDQAIADQELAVKLAEIALKRAETSLQGLKEITSLNLAAAERSKRYADEDYERYLKIDRPSSVKSAEFALVSSERSLEYEREELRQLEKMYRADDLTEETEEIVLRRQQHAVERAEHYLELAKQRHDQALRVDLPRMDQSIKDATTRKQIDFAQSKVLLPLDLARAELELEQTRLQLARQREQLEDLKADRRAMLVEAPFDGVVYYGRFDQGKWSGSGSAASKMKPGASVSGSETLMTVVKTRPLTVRVAVPEKALHRLRKNMRAVIVPEGFPNVRLSGSVSQIGAVPLNEGTFDARLSVSIGADEAFLVPSMACEVKLVPVLKRRTLVVPASAVGTDELDDQKHYVYLVTDDGKQVKQAVTLGERSGDRVEIVDGLVAGDKILPEYPKNSK